MQRLRNQRGPSRRLKRPIKMQKLGKMWYELISVTLII